MNINIIGCGKTAGRWNGEGPSIGVNDAGKFGHHLDYLVILNYPSQFENGRLEVIRNTPVKKVYTNYPNQWGSVLSAPCHMFTSRQWNVSNIIQKVSTNYLYHSRTSPFGAISLAFSWGFNEIILWGVDMVDHPYYNPSTGMFQNELAAYKTFCQSLKARGCEVYLGTEGSNLRFLPIWKHI